MAKKATSTIIKLPYGIVDAACVSSVSPAGTAVACVDVHSRTLAWIETGDGEQAKRVAKILGDLVFAVRDGGRVDPIDWTQYGFEG
ncbi:hypothetical protein F6455_13035 [Proteobacteria bacterium 005FR1]|nr:hypothetical protein [Proteobacteria bacterium 005FR1]